MLDEYDQFAVELEEDGDFRQGACGQPLPSAKRRRSLVTLPLRMRHGDCDKPSAQPAPAVAGPDAAPPSQPCGSGSQPAAPRGSAGSWSVRSIFLGGGAARPAQQAPQTVPPVPPGGGMQHTSGLAPATCLATPSFAADDDDVGPLTQMAAANTCVASAFCPHCGCFLADMGSTQQQSQHVAACAHAAPANQGCGARLQQQQPPQQQPQQQWDGGGCGSGSGSIHISAAAQHPLQQQPQLQRHGGEVEAEGWEEDEDEDEEGQDGNWSEHEEATQAAPAGRGQLGHECNEQLEGEAGADVDGDDEGGGGGGEDMGQGQEELEQGQAALHSWLHQLGLGKYADLFLRSGATLSLLPCLTDHDLQQMGIVALGARKKLLLAAEELLPASPPSHDGSDSQQQDGDSRWEEDEEGRQAGGLLPLQERQQAQAAAGNSGVGDWRALLAGTRAVSCDITQYFKPTGSSKKQATGQPTPDPGSILAYLKAADGSSLPAPAPKQPAGRGRGRGKPAAQQWAHKAVAAEGGGGGGKRWGPRAAQVLPIRQWQLVPGTNFIVDRFCNLPQQTPYRHWFLTHFHADHYKGLNGKFDRGTLYCSPPTTLLIQQQLRVKPGCIRSVPLNSPITVEGVRVTFLDANHCPGAVMILFEPPGRRPVLHTGDCRLIPQMQQEPTLAAVRGRAELILDTTYCSPEYAFPSQQEVLTFAIDAVKAEAFNPKTLFLFGSYTIGKERLFLEAARVLQRKIYVSVAKRKILDCLDLPEEYRSLLTTDDHETNLHAVPLWMVSQKHMAKLLKHYRGRFSTAVGFQPTGWTHQRDANQTRARGRRRQKGTIITYQVPYSEHSSFSELRQFVEWFRPHSIIPSVNSDGGGPKAQQLVRLLQGKAG